MMEFAKENPFPLAVLAGGLYLGLGRSAPPGRRAGWARTL